MSSDPLREPTTTGQRPAVVSLFSGGGGLDLGLELAGFGTRVTVESEPHACRTLRANQGHILPDGSSYLEACEIIQADVRLISGPALLRAARLRPGEAALLVGGPPCVTFSVAGRREGILAETGRLFEDYVRLLGEIRPTGFVFENVKGILTAVDEHGVRGGAFERIHEALAGEGYALNCRVVNAADYGVPQVRERVVILGLLGNRPPAFPNPTHCDPRYPPVGDREPWRDVRWAFRGLPPAAQYGEAPGVSAPNHVARRHTAQTVTSFDATAQGARNAIYKRERLRWDRPAKVVRAQGKPKADGSGQKHSSHQSIHPRENRMLTVRECARIQTFPDWYVLPQTLVNGYRIVGDAVPIELARALGTAMRREVCSVLDEQRGGEAVESGCQPSGTYPMASSV